MDNRFVDVIRALTPPGFTDGSEFARGIATWMDKLRQRFGAG
jgi:hypothetical protein